MDHAVTVGAQETKIPDLCLVAGFQRVNGLGVMALNEAFLSRIAAEAGYACRVCTATRRSASLRRVIVLRVPIRLSAVRAAWLAGGGSPKLWGRVRT